MTTDDIKRRFEYAARIGKFRVEEWLTPALSGDGLRVVATMTIGGKLYGMGFRWSGEKAGDLADRCLALCWTMSKLPDMVARGKAPLWHRQSEDMPLVGAFG